MDDETIETRQERREHKQKSKQERMMMHGRSLAKIYHDAVMKRLKKKQNK